MLFKCIFLFPCSCLFSYHAPWWSLNFPSLKSWYSCLFFYASTMELRYINSLTSSINYPFLLITYSFWHSFLTTVYLDLQINLLTLFFSKTIILLLPTLTSFSLLTFLNVTKLIYLFFLFFSVCTTKTVSSANEVFISISTIHIHPHSNIANPCFSFLL